MWSVLDKYQVAINTESNFFKLFEMVSFLCIENLTFYGVIMNQGTLITK